VTDPIDLDELERLEKAATPVPWRYVRAGKFLKGSTDNGIGSHYGSKCLIYTTPCDRALLRETHERQACDGELSAAARNALPALIAQLRAAREAQPTVPSAELARVLGRLDAVAAAYVGPSDMAADAARLLREMAALRALALLRGEAKP
jgi:hypothetical protein